MLVKAAVLWGVGEPWSVEEIELAGPKPDEVLVSYEASGLCHSDHHPRVGDFPVPLPLVGGHEGAGVVVEVGSDVKTLSPGDHVVASFVPACGRCRWCSTGHQNLCDEGARIGTGSAADGTFPRRARGQSLGAMALLGTFSPMGTVSEYSLVKIDDDIPLSRACLIGCGITTGWGSAVNTADVRPGDVVVVIGFGGVGSGAVQGARLAGAASIIVIEQFESKRERALKLGATHFFTSVEQAQAALPDMTRGVLADSVILTVGQLAGSMIGEALALVRKGGAVVVTALAPAAVTQATFSLAMFTLYQKRLLGSLFGEANPRADIPRLLQLYRSGQLLLDEVITHEYALDDINQGFDDMLDGTNIRGIVVHEQ